MANRRKVIPSFVSIEVGSVRSLAETMEDEEWGKWSKKALDDLSIGCVRKDTDPRVKELYQKAKSDMDTEYLRKKEWYEKNKVKNTADGDTREGSQAIPNGSAITRNETRANDALEPSATISADAPTREDGEFKSDIGYGANLESATSANNSEARQSQARESQRRAGADSVRGTPLHSAPARSRAKNSRCPNSREEFHAFVADNNLHEGLAEEWYAIHEARGWVDENGNPIKNWRGALKNFCIKVEQKRRTA